MTAILLATTNQGKLREFGGLLEPLAVCSPHDLGINIEVEETGNSFRENALLKSRAFADASRIITLADDSGLEVDALEGAPGVHSARFGGPGLDDTDRCELLLEALRGVTEHERRSARFRCCLVAVSVDGRKCEAEGACEGSIAPKGMGSGGFGYDPVFLVPEFGQTMAQLAPEVKGAISHRARAVEAIKPRLIELFPEVACPAQNRVQDQSVSSST